jgi:hypothetical protein
LVCYLWDENECLVFNGGSLIAWVLAFSVGFGNRLVGYNYLPFRKQ